MAVELQKEYRQRLDALLAALQRHFEGRETIWGSDDRDAPGRGVARRQLQ